jgi:large subunit ribosomal protein L29
MSTKDLRSKSQAELVETLHELLKEQFKARMQHASGQLPQTAELKTLRRNIARVKTIISENNRSEASA